MQPTVRAVWSVVLGLSFTATPAVAETKHYGGKVAVVDAIAVGTFAGGVACIEVSGVDAVELLCGLAALGGAITYGVGGPVQHSRHGKKITPAIDVAMRLVLPFGGLAAASAIADCPSSGFCTEQVIGAGIGIAIASTLDALVLARAEVATPYVAPAAGGATVGVVGRF